MFLKSENLNPTKFADIIGVQRSSISHILTGRNKPSFDFLVRIFEKFPVLNVEWLILGKGNMYKQQTNIQKTLFDNIDNEKVGDLSNDEITVSEISLKETETGDIALETGTDTDQGLAEGKKLRQDAGIDKIVIFYTDRTFSDFRSR